MGSQSLGIGPGRRTSARHRGTGHGVMFGQPSDIQWWGDFPDGGGYPLGFMEWALATYEAWSGRWIDPADVLHLCSGSMRTGITVDIRSSCTPTVVADCRRTPFRDESFDFIMADPPYSPEYARSLYGTEATYPKPGQLLVEANRLLRPGGYVGLLHHQVPVFRRPLRLRKVYAVHRGLGFSLVAWSLLQKESA